MSADRWSICPKCAKKHDEYLDELYGKVPKNVYDARMDEKVLKDTLGEYYEVYLDDDGEFVVHYEGICRECGFKYTYNFSDQVDLK